MAAADHRDNQNQGSKTAPAFNLDFPFGAQPDISMFYRKNVNSALELMVECLVRANQKDVYYQTVLQEQMTSVCQQFFGRLGSPLPIVLLCYL